MSASLSLVGQNLRVSSIKSCLCICAAHNSTIASVTRTKRMVYPRTYPTLLVYPDGSTITIRYKEPRGVIKMPQDFSKLSDAEKKKVLANRKPKQKLETIEDFGDSFDVSEYSKYFKH
ncbi:39S ribosomal protein l55, mitochondrial [Plakobranchus ocellatus]|uniref:39S ribosomal protein l55, mitochondrial n=1 Tax=Plakobranchus ocellatus TaxID=259542 RepID=A0AAV3ZH30_9GAST|nr:39S ribosomal protein l55, mitochondrial [Plakobranchus ocellatus]